MNTQLILKIRKALEKAAESDQIIEREMDLKLPNSLFVIYVPYKTAIIDIPADSRFILVNQFNNQQKAVKLLICFRKNEGLSISLGVSELINSGKWKNLNKALDYLKKRESWVLSSSKISLGKKDFVTTANPMFIDYHIELEVENEKVIAQLIEKIKTTVDQSARQFNT